MASPDLDAALDDADAAADQPVDDTLPKQYKGITDMLQDAEAWQVQHLRDAIRPDVNKDRYMASLLTAVRKTPALIELGAQADGRRSILAAMIRCAELGLEVNNDLGEGYLIAFKRNKGRSDERWELQVIIGYKGYLKLAAESGNLKNIAIHEVYDNDKFRIVYGTGPDAGLTHEPLLKGDRGNIYCYYGIVEFHDGGYFFTHMTLADIEERKQRSGSVRAGVHTPWDTDPVPMSKKTVARAMVPFMRLGASIRRALADDEKFVTADGELEYLDATAVETKPGPPVVDGPTD